MGAEIFRYGRLSLSRLVGIADQHLDSTSGSTNSVAKRHTADTLRTPVPRGPPSRYETTPLDLTRDELHTSSSSTVETFGESRAIWREDSATRKEPPAKKGKKRKSDEFEEDELQADVPQANVPG